VGGVVCVWVGGGGGGDSFECVPMFVVCIHALLINIQHSTYKPAVCYKVSRQ